MNIFRQMEICFGAGNDGKRIVRILWQSAVSEKWMLCREIRAIISCQTVFSVDKNLKNQNSNGTPFEDFNHHSFSRAVTSKGTKSIPVVVFGGGKAYDGTPNRRKQSIVLLRKQMFSDFL